MLALLQPWLEGPSQFFAYWENFSTERGFWWCDEYNPHEASNRQEKRAIEKHNQKCREIGKKEYNEHVRRLATWVKKRDPRRAEHLKRVAEEVAIKAERQRQKEAQVRRLRQEKSHNGEGVDIEVGYACAKNRKKEKGKGESDFQRVFASRMSSAGLNLLPWRTSMLEASCFGPHQEIR